MTQAPTVLQTLEINTGAKKWLFPQEAGHLWGQSIHIPMQPKQRAQGVAVGGGADRSPRAQGEPGRKRPPPEGPQALWRASSPRTQPEDAQCRHHEATRVHICPIGCASVQSVCTELLLCAKPYPQEVGFGVGTDGQHAWLSSSSSAWTGAKPSRLKEPQMGGSSAGFCDSAEQPLSAPFTEARTPNNSPEQCLRGMVSDEGGDEREWFPSREWA